MKAVIKEKEKAEIKFPCLMECEGLIVLFVGEYAGTVIVADKGHSIGSFYRDWEFLKFTPFTGTVELSNE